MGLHFGPAFLTLEEAEWPASVLPGSNTCSAATLNEFRKGVEPALSSITVQCHQVSVSTVDRLKPEDYSDLNRFIRVRAWINRFLLNCRLQPDKSRLDALLNEEIQQAETDVIQESQQRCFPEELKA